MHEISPFARQEQFVERDAFALPQMKRFLFDERVVRDVEVRPRERRRKRLRRKREMRATKI